MKAYRDRGRTLYGITEPEILLPESAHAAFIKGGHYFGMKLVFVDSTADWRADVSDMKKKLTRNTVMVVASAPTFPHGVIDPVEEMAAALGDHPAGFHVDACLGGFILPWVEQAGQLQRQWSFAVPRVSECRLFSTQDF